MKILLGTFAVLAALVGGVIAVGWMLPVRHRVSRQATYPASPDMVFAAITKVEDFPSWRSNVKKVDVVIGEPGVRSWRETGSDGAILYVADQITPATRFVTRIADRALPFGGTWTYDLTASGQGTTLRITEDGEVYNLLFRFMSRFVFGHHTTLDTYLRDLGKRFGATPAISA